MYCHWCRQEPRPNCLTFSFLVGISPRKPATTADKIKAEIPHMRSPSSFQESLRFGGGLHTYIYVCVCVCVYVYINTHICTRAHIKVIFYFPLILKYRTKRKKQS